jgi:hypothetical protein
MNNLRSGKVYSGGIITTITEELYDNKPDNENKD